jgi:hypothetical protein
MNKLKIWAFAIIMPFIVACETRVEIPWFKNVCEEYVYLSENYYWKIDCKSTVVVDGIPYYKTEFYFPYTSFHGFSVFNEGRWCFTKDTSDYSFDCYFDLNEKSVMFLNDGTAISYLRSVDSINYFRHSIPVITNDDSIPDEWVWAISMDLGIVGLLGLQQGDTLFHLNPECGVINPFPQSPY